MFSEGELEARIKGRLMEIKEIKKWYIVRSPKMIQRNHCCLS